MADTEKLILTLEANDEASQKIEAIAKALRNLDKEADNVGGGTSSGISTMISNFERGVSRVNSISRQWNNTMAGFNRSVINIVKDMGSAIYDFTSDSIDNFTKFSEQHAKVLGVMRTDYDKTAESQARFFADAQKLKEQAMQIGTYGFNGQGSLSSIVDVSQAQESLLKAGIDPDKIINTKVLQDVLTFAQANGLNTDSAVSTAVTIGNQFGYDETEWTGMLDKITYAADMSIVDVPDIVQSLKWASGISAGLNRPLEEVLAMLTVLGDFGIKGSQAGTGIQALLTRLLTGDTTVITQAQAEIAPGNALKAFYDFSKFAKSDGSSLTYEQIANAGTYEELGALSGNLRPMDEVLDGLNEAMEGMTDEEQAWFAKKLFGLYQMKSAYALLNGEDVDLNAVIEEIETQSDGTNAGKLSELLASQYGQLKSLNYLWEGVKTDVGDRLSPFVGAIRNELFNFLKNNGNYNINFDNLRSALDESCNLIEEKYGSAIANAVRNVGELTIDLTQVTQAIGPALGDGLLKLIGDALNGGGLFGPDGIFFNWDTMIENMYKNAEALPEDLRDLGEAIATVVDWCGKLVAFNLGVKIVELISSALQMLTIAGNMIVKAANVIVTGGSGTGGIPTGKGTTPTGKGTTSKGKDIIPDSIPVGPAGKALKGGKSVVGSADDIATYFGASADDVVSVLGKQATYTVDDVARGFGTSADDVIATFGKFTNTGGKLLKGVGKAGTWLQVGLSAYEAYNEFSSGDTKGGIQAVAGGAGSIGGGWGGAALGAAIGTAIAPGIGTAVGTVLGAFLGSWGGDKVGRGVAGAAYDLSKDEKYKEIKKKVASDNRIPAMYGGGAGAYSSRPTLSDLKANSVTVNSSNTKFSSSTKLESPPFEWGQFRFPSTWNMDNVTVNPSSATITGEVKAPEIKTPFTDFKFPSVWNMDNITVNPANATITGEVKTPEVKIPEIKTPWFNKDAINNTVENTINIDDSITMQPKFNVSAPNVNVSVKVDQSGKVTKNVTILNPGQGTMLDNWYHRTSSQFGKILN